MSSSSTSGEEDVSYFDAEAGMSANRSGPGSFASDQQAQSNTNLAGANIAARRRPKSMNGDYFSTSRNRYSLPARIPAVPAIPAHHLATGKRATLQPRRTATGSSIASKESSQTSPVLPVQRSSSSGGEARRDSFRSAQGQHGSVNSAPLVRPTDFTTRRKSLSAIQSHRETLAKLETGTSYTDISDMNRFRGKRSEDLFLALANDQSESDGVRPPSRGDRAASRASFAGKRHSLPVQELGMPSSGDNRPKTSGHVFGNRPPSRSGQATSDLQRHAERYRNSPSRAGYLTDDGASASGLSSSGRRQRFSLTAEHSANSPGENHRAPDLPQYGRRRPSFGNASSQARQGQSHQLSTIRQDSHSESPAESSEPKQSNPDSGSVDSDTADTVWDELDDLKSRIKRVERTGRLPLTSGGAVSGDSSERPRTATTAPTTIDSSPKHDKMENKQQQDSIAEQTASEHVVGGSTAKNIHPNLHAALARAKSLLSAPLYRSLEATAADALQLIAMTGSAGPQGTAFSAAAIINGVTVSDRHVRRKTDTMCRNLTDLCIVLCEGKHEAPSVTASPVLLATPLSNSPSLRYTRSSLGPTDSLTRTNSRPMSRLEARRTSMLGSQAGSIGNSPSGAEDVSASEHETTPSIKRKEHDPRFARPQSRLQRIRQQHYNQPMEDDDPTIRPPSRAMTDIGRSKPSGPREYSTPQRSPSLRDSLVARRANTSAYENNKEYSRIASLGSDSGRKRRFHDPSTPPVLEEESIDGGEEYQPASLPPSRRVSSLNRHAPRRMAGELQGRIASLSGRRPQVVVE
ncbi:hypothetical protein LTR09_003642 [Extremus antarcticus]|uniref:Uncharacterized protein n=1 Tax=Extremus antarcticus TaxID=702011 RepID=A0AAJ0DSC6_9PEZI|nr:hypothetical protein LTR09_003642 [Extremus antarcticus]